MSILKRGNNVLMVIYCIIIFCDHCNGLNIKIPENTAANVFPKTSTESVTNSTENLTKISKITTETVIEDISVNISKATSEDPTKTFTKASATTDPEKESETLTKNPSKTPDPKASEKVNKISEETKKILETYGKHYDVTTLKSADDEEEEEFECKEETPEEKLKRDYENFLTDSGRIQYISQGPLPYDKKAAQQSRCRLLKQLNQTMYSARKAQSNVRNRDSLRGGKFFDITLEPKPGQEYIFSSVEYYDDIVDFDVAKCPNDVAEIILEQEVLREYDMDCEQIVAWTSLEEAEVQPE